MLKHGIIVSKLTRVVMKNRANCEEYEKVLKSSEFILLQKHEKIAFAKLNVLIFFDESINDCHDSCNLYTIY